MPFDPPFWNWLILTGIFLLVEVLTVSFFFLFWGVAALVLVGITLAVPTLDWRWQYAIFAALSLIAILLWRQLARRWQSDKHDTAALLNHRGAQYIGRQFTLDTPVENGYGKLKIGDSLWTINGENLPAGTTIVIIREDLLERCSSRVPDVWNYRSHIERQGMYNTPATYPIYISGLVFRWLQSQGGVGQMETINTLKAKTLYAAIDNSGGFYRNRVAPAARSKMNVIFTTGNKELDELFVQESTTRGLRLLGGYKSMGGMRASIYNAMPLQGVEALIEFMREFQKRYG